jgi:predicted lipid-binding transport protein (Tim44 family)
MSATIIILALVAAFIGLRLYSVLGKHGQDEGTPLPRKGEAPRTTPVVAPRAVAPDSPRPAATGSTGTMVYEPAAEIGIRAILGADRSFDVGRFLTGAKAAYRTLYEAYWKGDRDTLRTLCDADSFAAFDDAITAREASGETLDNRIVTIDKAIIVAASLDRRTARIAVKFDADIAAVTRDRDGKVIAGSMTDASANEDVWSFVRDLDSSDPTWLLDETDAA